GLGEAQGQDVSPKLKRSAKVNYLAKAGELRQGNPTESIRLLNEVIRSNPNTAELTAAFLLLGDIYTDIGQAELALGRYDQALELIPSDNNDQLSTVYLKRGRVLLTLADYGQSRASFASCLSLAPASSAQNIACTEGLADLEARLNNFSQSQDLYKQVKQAAPDSLTQMRVNYKQADVYLQQDDISNAANSLDQALTQVPRKQELSKEVKKDLIATNARVRSNVIKAAPELDKDVVESLPDAPISLVTSDNLTRFKALREVGDLAGAEEKLNLALNTVSEETPVEVATEVYAEGADFYLDRGLPKQAAEIYQSYTLANDQLLAERRIELDQQVAVLKEQQSVDLSLKDLKAAEDTGRLLSQQVSLQRWIIYLLAALLLGALLSVFLVLRNVRRRQRANQALLLRNQQTRMNPHFIFNSLNSINNYIARQDERSANRYLGRFAKLMRNVLDQSGKDFVSLTEELEQLALYLELEKERFLGKFSYALPDPAGYENIELPPMILQPFVENAIWHGLRYRDSGGELQVEVKRKGEAVELIITDNGIGRERSLALKTKNQRSHRSTGMETTRQRLELVNAYYGKDFSVSVKDAFPEAAHVGTRVTITL
ncbi:MAG: histidine kinase, partial [Bacteroidota bacterium]